MSTQDKWRVVKSIGDDRIVGVDIIHECLERGKDEAYGSIDYDVFCTQCGEEMPDTIKIEYLETLLALKRHEKIGIINADFKRMAGVAE